MPICIQLTIFAGRRNVVRDLCDKHKKSESAREDKAGSETFTSAENLVMTIDPCDDLTCRKLSVRRQDKRSGDEVAQIGSVLLDPQLPHEKVFGKPLRN